jgi:NAD(P)-dependent dehydrogenase (short-subunit alcohol dehydrogenase family)
LSSQHEVNDLADKVLRHLLEINSGRLDVLVSNAGTVRSRFTPTADGLEMQFAVNYLAGFILAQRLLPALEKSPVARILLTSSDSHRFGRMHWRNVMLGRFYSLLAAYSQSKLSNVLFAAEFNRRFSDLPVRAYAVDPGLVKTNIGFKDTGILASFFWQKHRRSGLSPCQAACTFVHLCKMPAGWRSDFVYYKNCEPLAPAKKALDEETGRRLWNLSERLTSLDVHTYAGKT